MSTPARFLPGRSATVCRAMPLATLALIAATALPVNAIKPKPATNIKPKPVAAPRIDFNREIRPILAANCFPCHGQDTTARQAGLRLDLQEQAVATRNGGRAIDPGHPERSAVVARVNAGNSPLLMPPASSGHRLTEAQRALLTQWIRQGARYEQHWAFRPIAPPPLPAVRNRAWIRNPIDAFVLARLEKAGLAPAPEADRYTQIRRLSLDLTGLPPTPAEADAFARDRAPDAYERVVDRLLASPHYGEHWARMWLDLARYADTQGYEKDLPRTIWRYRDWVIDAFNADMPYDRFTIEQIAGDLLPHPTDDQLLATAFHRNTMTNTEGGVDPEEFRVAAIKDRVDTTVQVWMGLTMGCAKCHSHKYDPITLQDYYRFYALFNQTEDANRFDETPTAPMPTGEQRRKLAGLDERLKGLREAFWRPLPETEPARHAWEADLAKSGLWSTPRLEAGRTTSGAALTPRADGALLVQGPHADQDTYTLTISLPAGTVRALRLEALKDPSLPNGGPGRDANDQNVVTSEIRVALQRANGEQTPVPLERPRADFEQGGWPIANAIDGKDDTGWAWAPQNGQPHVAVFDLKTPLAEPNGKLVITLVQNYPRLQHGCFRISLSEADPKLLTAEMRTLSELAAVPEGKRSPEDQRRLDRAFRETHAPTAALYADLSAAEKERADAETGVPRIPVLRDLSADRQRITRIHQRGNFLDPGETVQPGLPAAFGPIPSGAPMNRLGAAQWLVSGDNPLTARVAVNRVWARLFGTGLVETEEDFGAQGAPPTHPELLNWLAAVFKDEGGRMKDEGTAGPSSSFILHPSSLRWSIKALIRLIITSATYRQASEVTPPKRRIDPRNALLSRGPRFRLPAEVIRDQALAVTGLLSGKMYGPSVMPPQPEGIWRTVYSGMKWQTSPGEDRYRRALYTFWRRTSPYPAMTTFDAGSGEFCVVRRVRTNTPLQALVTLNDPAFVETAGALGRTMRMAATPRDRIVLGFRRVLTRPPSEPEIARLTRLYTQALAGYRARPAAATALLAAASATPPGAGPTPPGASAAPPAASGATPAVVSGDPEIAACTTVANVLLNLDEALTKP